jgi:hypothetical protein
MYSIKLERNGIVIREQLEFKNRLLLSLYCSKYRHYGWKVTVN